MGFGTIIWCVSKILECMVNAGTYAKIVFLFHSYAKYTVCLVQTFDGCQIFRNVWWMLECTTKYVLFIPTPNTHLIHKQIYLFHSYAKYMWGLVQTFDACQIFRNAWWMLERMPKWFSFFIPTLNILCVWYKHLMGVKSFGTYGEC